MQKKTEDFFFYFILKGMSINTLIRLFENKTVFNEFFKNIVSV